MTRREEGQSVVGMKRKCKYGKQTQYVDEKSKPKGEEYSPVVSHEATSVTGMKNPSERLRRRL